MDTYCMAEYAIGGFEKRNHFEDIRTFKLNGERRDCARSQFLFKGKHADGAHITDCVAFDFDGKDLSDTKARVKDFADSLYYNYCLPLDVPRYYFSGSKGFHMLVPMQAVCANPQPSEDFYKVVKMFASRLGEGFVIDTTIYNKRGMLRIENTINTKSGLYKVPLSFDEICTLSATEVKELAKTPREIELLDIGEIMVNSDLNHIWNESWDKIHDPKPTQILLPKTAGEEVNAKESQLAEKACETLRKVKLDYPAWRDCGFALCSLGYAEGLRQFKLLSDNGYNYNPNNNISPEKQFDECSKRYDGRIGLGTLFYIAEQYGFTFPLEYISFTDTANASRFVTYHGDKVRYNNTNHRWYIWNGKIWQRDDRQAIYELVRDTSQRTKKILMNYTDTAQTDALLKGISKLQNNYTQDMMLRQAQSFSEISCTETDFDKDSNVFNVLNGTIRFTDTGYTFTEHKKEDMLTQLIEIEFNSNAVCPKWQKFLDDIFSGNTEMISYVQRAIGYTLSGSTSENCLLFMYGGGSNGKSTFAEVLRNLFGVYHRKADASLITVKNNDSNTNDRARLKGARLVILSEIEQGRRLNESLVKDLTGGDVISARFLHQEFFEYIPQFVLWLYGNHKPVFRGQDDGIKRRMRLIPFRKQFAGEEKKTREEIIIPILKEISGILLWALHGYEEWKAKGLKEPEQILNATAEYIDEMDTVKQFINQCCQIVNGSKCLGKKLYELYQVWMKENGEGAVTKQKDFYNSLVSKGFEKYLTGGAVTFKGISLGTNGAELLGS